MSSHDRRSAGRRRAWGRGPIILRFEPLEKREVLSAIQAGLPDLVASSFVTTQNADWNDPINASGQVTNQGNATVTTPFNVAIYASHGTTIGPYSVMIGEVTIPAGLEPGQSVPFSTTVKLPNSPVPGMSPNGVVYIDLKVDPQGVVRESHRSNNRGLGLGYDESMVQITPHQPPRLVTSSIGVADPNVQWGGSIVVTAQISNPAYGNAPGSRAQVVLTPAGATPGGASDVTIGNITVPPVPAWAMVNVEQSIPLPVTPPKLLTGASQFILSILPDADFLSNTVYPHVPTGGAGVDEALVNITVLPGTTPPDLGALSDLAPGAVTTSSTTLNWGQSFQTQTSIQNLGQADPGPFRVRFLLVGASGDTSHGIFLGDAIVNGLQPGSIQQVTQNLTLPLRLPAGVTLSSLGTGKIAVIVDPENALNETFKNNNIATSAPITLRLLGTDGNSFVPNLPAPAQLLPVVSPTARTKARTSNAHQASTGNSARPKKLFLKPPPPKNSLLHNLSVFPKRVNDLLKKYI
jgi:hypothetical protein